MLLHANLSNIFLQEHIQVTPANPLKQLYHPVILGVYESEQSTPDFSYGLKKVNQKGKK